MNPAPKFTDLQPCPNHNKTTPSSSSHHHHHPPPHLALVLYHRPIMQKENPNPIIHTTNRSSHASHSPAAPLLGSAAIHRYHLGSPSPSNSHTNIASTKESNAFSDENLSLQGSLTTAEERSVALALSAAAYPPSSTQSTVADTAESSKLDILQQAGFALFQPQRIQKQCKAIRYPSYAPSNRKKQPLYDQELIQGQEHKREEITANEVFDIIRNIQDPEHPLTLEQLNVVRMELIDVIDVKGEDSGEELSASHTNGRNMKKFSIVHVQFT